MHCLAFLLTILGAFLVLSLRCKTCQRLFYLTCYVFLVNLKRFLRTILFLFLTATLLATLLTTVWLLRCLATCCLYVDALLCDALALLLLAILRFLLCSLLLTLTTLLLLRLLLWTSALVQFVEVDRTEHLHLRRKFLLALKCEHAVFFFIILFLLRLLYRQFSLLRLLLNRFWLLFLHWFWLRFFLWLRFLILLFFYHRLCLFLCLGLQNRLFCLHLGFLHRFLRLCFNLFLLFNRLCLLLFRSRLTNTLKVNLSERREFLLWSSLHLSLNALLSLFLFLVFYLLREQFVGVNFHFLVFLERLNERIILRIVELKTRFCLHFTEIRAFLKEFNCRLKSYV